MLELRDLSKRFGGLTVTDGVSLTVEPGEIHALIGPNGAGKTTLMGLISGTLTPDRGAVLIGGQDVTAWPPERRVALGMARTFQITSIVPGFTARENVALAVQARRGSSFRFVRAAARDAAVNDAAAAELARVGLAARAGMVAGALSHGEQRQLELAVALACQPRLLLLDEPLAGAGPAEAEQLVALIAGLRRQFAVLLVEHDMQAVFALADRISVLVYGRVLVTGTPDAIRAHPEVRAAYLGEDELA
jgi:branched-chain amino acid transport system ATP-binding protein